MACRKARRQHEKLGSDLPGHDKRGDGDLVLRTFTFSAALLWLLIPSTPSYAQDLSAPPPQPSLGDVARQARKDKEKNSTPAKATLTEDDLSSGKGLGAIDVGSFSEAKIGGGSGGNADATNKALAEGWAGLQRGEAALNKLAPLDRATLAKIALQDNNVDFPHRTNWEERLFAAKQVYVAHSRELISEMKQLLTAAQAMQQGNVNPNDPSAQALSARAQELLQDAVRTESGFKAIVAEGQDLAKQGSR
jgi:hypothetical protein